MMRMLLLIGRVLLVIACPLFWMSSISTFFRVAGRMATIGFIAQRVEYEGIGSGTDESVRFGAAGE
jgi:hypothetical protein